MKKITLYITLGLLVAIPAYAHAMTLADVTQQLAIYKQAPAVLGASATGTTSTEVAGSGLPSDAPKVLLTALKYSNGGNARIIEQRLKSGSTDKDRVKVLQVFLIAKGYLAADPTGYYGPQTRAALKKFQMDKHISGGDGSIVGPVTMNAIQLEVETTTAQ